MSTLSTVIQLIKAAKQYAPVIAAVSSGIGMILSKNYDEGLSTIFQALTLVFSGAAAVKIQGAAARSGPK